MHLYDNMESGNGYKVRLLLNQLGIACERTEVDIFKGHSHTPEFLARNPNGRIPLLEYEPGHYLAESDAILFYLAEGTDFLPADRLERARVLQWMFFEQYSHEPNLAVARVWLHHPDLFPHTPEELAARQEKGNAALGVMEGHLAANDYFVAGRYTIADIALYAYTHVAHEAGLDLGGFLSVRAWLDRVAAQPGHIPITQG